MTQSQNVALYFHRLGDVGGGAERMICAFAGALADRGFAVHLASWDSAAARTFYPLDRRVIWHKLGAPTGLRGKFARIMALYRVLRDNQVSVLAGFVMSGDRTVYAAARLAGVRLIAAERNGPTLYRLRHGALTRLATFASLHLTDAIAVQFPTYVQGYPRTLRRRIRVIPNPVQPAAACAAPDKSNADGRFTLLAVGRLDSVQKRPALLVQAFSRLDQRFTDWQLCLVGDGPAEAELRRMVEALGLGERVRIGATVTDLQDAYSAAHLFVTPSRWEGFPNALAEAMAHGLPAVGFRDADGVAELVVDSETGWLADGLDDPDALTLALEQAMSDPQARRRRGRLAVRAMRRYEPEVQFDLWVDLMRDLARP